MFKKYIGLIILLSFIFFGGTYVVAQSGCPNKDTLPEITIADLEDVGGGIYEYDETPTTFNVSFKFPYEVKAKSDYDLTANSNFTRDPFDPRGKEEYDLPFTAISNATLTIQLPANTVFYDLVSPSSSCANVASNSVTIRYKSSVSAGEDCEATLATKTYSLDSSNGSAYTTLSDANWYINKGSTSAVAACFASTECKGFVCPSGTTDGDCEALFEKKYNMLKNLFSIPPYGSNMSPADVRKVQDGIRQTNCGTSEDCMFGRGTTKSILGCDVCKGYDSRRTTPVGTGCETERATINDKGCCATDEDDGDAKPLVCDKPGETNAGGKCVCDPSATVDGKPNCCGIELLTNVPFIGKCITLLSKKDKVALGNKAKGDKNTLIITEDEAFPRLMLGLTKILVTVILLTSFIAIIVAGVMITASGSSDDKAKTGKDLIIKVVVALALLGASGVILRLINPNFFG